MDISNKILIGLSGLLICLSSFVATIEAAEVYTWVDSKGVKHYSDKPFKSAKKISFSVATPKIEPKETVIEKPELFDLNDAERLTAECTTAKNNIANLLKGGKILEKNADGEDVELSIDQINTKLSESQEYVKRYCDKATTETGES